MSIPFIWAASQLMNVFAKTDLRPSLGTMHEMLRTPKAQKGDMYVLK